jgi:hypothetical protein
MSVRHGSPRALLPAMWPCADGGVGEHLLPELDAIELACGVEDLEARLQPDQEADGRNLPELARRIDFDLHAAARALLNAGLERLHPFMETSLTVGDDSFIVNCCVLAAPAKKHGCDGSQTTDPASHFCSRADRDY